MNEGDGGLMDPDDPLAEAGPHARAARGDCPAPEILQSWHEGTLPTADAARVEEHIALCGLCELALQQLAEFGTVLPSPPQAQGAGWNWIPGFLRQPGFLWALIAGLSVPAYWGIRGPRIVETKITTEVPVPVPAIRPVRVIELGGARGERQQVLPERETGGAEAIAFSFRAPKGPADYRVVLIGENDRELTGEVGVTCPASVCQILVERAAAEQTKRIRLTSATGEGPYYFPVPAK